MPQLPGRAALFQHRHDPVSGLADPSSIHHVDGICCRRERGGDHRRDGVTATKHCCRFGQPGGPLFGVRAGFVFGVASLQRRLLGQVKSFDRGWRPAMIRLKLDRELAPSGVDQGTSAGPALAQSEVNTDNLADGSLRRVGPGPFGEPHPEPVAEVVFEGGVVGLRCRHLCLEQHPTINTQPASVEALDLVRDRHVGVQIRIAGPAVAVGEPSPHHTADVDLPDSLWPRPGEQRLLLDEPQRIPNGGSVRPLDRRGRSRVGERPQCRDRLHRRKRQVITGDRLRAWSRVLRDLGCELSGVDRVAAVLCVEELLRQLSPMRARDEAATSASAGAPIKAFRSAIRFATSTRNGVASSTTRNGAPSHIASSTASSMMSETSKCCARTSASGCMPCPNKLRICSAVTGSPASTPSMPSMPEPTQTPW